ncbi:MAG: alpha/beta hydrolase [Lewinellaceae bacterium]|nr:alpha/beta hydrolase [Saprospiraceae bacterium]MCB9338414.1 alpha/beta hydrolase [Lewinellaceae bacterium]
MKIKKRYIVLAVLAIGLFTTCHMEFMKFRQSDAKTKTAFAEKGLPGVGFQDYETAGQPMHFTVYGNDTLPLVVLVHGAPGSSSACLDYLMDTALTNHACVVALDRPGYGYSGFGKTERSLAKQAAAIKPILEKYRRKKAVLVGHSFGGPVIARMAMDFPELVDGLVIVAGSIDPALEPHYWWQHPLDWRAIRWMMPPAFRVANQEILPLPEELTDMLPRWKEITCPVTVVQGTKDNLVAPGNADFAERMLTNSEKVEIIRMEGGSHFIFWSERGLIIQEILKIINR